MNYDENIQCTGGTSQCTLTSQSGVTVFEGELSLDRTDRASSSTRAFAAIRAEMPRRLRALQDYMGLEMRVRWSLNRLFTPPTQQKQTTTGTYGR